MICSQDQSISPLIIIPNGSIMHHSYSFIDSYGCNNSHLIFCSQLSENMKQSRVHSLSVILQHNHIIYFESPSKKMKLSQSIATETTKQSQLKIPLLQTNPESPSAIVTIFTEKDGKKYKLQLPLQSKTINELILEATYQFNANFELKLKPQPSCYFLYAARKNGKICSDYPALEPSQNIMLTKLNYYHLKSKTQEVERARIKSNFGWQRKQQIKTKERTFCPCFFGL